MKLIGEFEIHALPALPNTLQYKHWRFRHRQAKIWKALVFNSCNIYGLCNLKLKKAKITYTRYSSRTVDADNLCFSYKHVQDGLVEACVITNDSPEVIGTPIYLQEKCKRINARIKIRIEA